jgi:hypothetical protein
MLVQTNWLTVAQLCGAVNSLEKFVLDFCDCVCVCFCVGGSEVRRFLGYVVTLLN